MWFVSLSVVGLVLGQTLVVYGQSFLSVNSESNTLEMNGETVFLSGVNQPWVNYGSDFGDNQSNGIFCQLNETIANVTMNSGNSVRMWLHVEGATSPLFNSSGYVTGTDSANSLINDMRLYLHAAAKQNVLIFFALWNGAEPFSSNLKGIINDELKLQSYIDNALIPMVKALKNETALGGWEIINEPEGSVATGDKTNDPCTDTTGLTNSGANWSGNSASMVSLQKFVYFQSAAIHSIDNKALVTVGSWCERSMTDEFGYTNYWKDECLIKAAAGGGDSLKGSVTRNKDNNKDNKDIKDSSNGVLDFYQFHSYGWQNQYSAYSPFQGLNVNSYNLSKPLVIGEFASASVPSVSITEMYEMLYDNGYSGAWDWDAIGQDNLDTMAIANKGMKTLKNKKEVDITVDGGDNIDLPGRCWCSDVPPSGGYTCQQQASWGKCGESWMQGYCCQSCFACNGCT